MACVHNSGGDHHGVYGTLSSHIHDHNSTDPYDSFVCDIFSRHICDDDRNRNDHLSAQNTSQPHIRHHHHPPSLPSSIVRALSLTLLSMVWCICQNNAYCNRGTLCNWCNIPYHNPNISSRSVFVEVVVAEVVVKE